MRRIVSRYGDLARLALPTLILAALHSPRGLRRFRTRVSRILVVRLDGIGDFVLMSPFLRELRGLYPDATITLLVRENVAPLAQACPYVDRVVPMLPCPERDTFSSYSKYAVAFIRHMRNLADFADRNFSEQVDLAIQPRWDADEQWATAMTFLSGASIRVGYSTRTTPVRQLCNRGHGYLLTKVLPPGPRQHEAERNLDIIRFLGGRVESPAAEVWFTFEDDSGAAQFLNEHGLPDGRPIIGFGVGAFQMRRRWPFYGELIQLLLKDFEFVPLLLAGPGDAPLVNRIQAGCPSAIVMEGMSLRVVAAVLSRCTAFVGNDSGPMHLAAAAGLPVVDISCHPVGGNRGNGNDPERFAPLSDRKRVVRPKVFRDDCEGWCQKDIPHCIAGITPDEVASAAFELGIGKARQQYFAAASG